MSWILHNVGSTCSLAALLGLTSPYVPVLIEFGYLVAWVLFTLGLKGMTHPRTAARGNGLAAWGMAAAIAAAVLAAYASKLSFGWGSFTAAAIGVAIGSVIGAVSALRVQMTAMPQMVAMFNGWGGLASVFVAWGALIRDSQALAWDSRFATGASAVIGAVTFSGSMLAFAKLQEYKAFRQPYRLPLQQPINAALALLCLAATLAIAGGMDWLYLPLAIASLVLGVFLVNPIGGADMPVVIALLNSYSGLAAAATGFVINNNVLIISGSLVGASGVILSNLMCQAMNRSLFNVLFGVMGAQSSSTVTDEIYAKVRTTSADDIALMLDAAQRVVIVPGYGLAVAQAQHAVRELAKLLEKKGVTVEYAIHPVAGRMPGHMNVLLAEADIDYDKLKEMDDINPTLGTVDLAIVIGANDVVNPLAQTDPNSPIAGMPIIEVHKARTVIVIKRSLSPGFAGIPNPLFAAENTLMFYGDGQQAVMEIVSAVKSL